MVTSPILRHDATEIAARVAALARRLEADLAGQPLLVVGILRGSALFLADLVRSLHLPLRFEFIDVTRQGDDDDAAGIRFFRRFEVGGENLLLLKDVVTTGVVESYLLAQLRAQKPRSLRLACIVDRPAARRVELVVDHALFEAIEPDLWVGYGLDSGDGTLAHSPDLGVLAD